MAQSYDPMKDTAFITKKRMPQQNEFWANNYSFPAKPRNMWEIGVGAGIPTVSGDVQSVLPTFGFEGHIRKSLGYLFSLRLQYFYGNAKGLSWLASENFGKNTAWERYYAPVRSRTTGDVTYSRRIDGATSPTKDIVFYNYKTQIQDLSLQGLVSFHNIRFHKAKTNIQLYGGAGIGASLYDTKVNAYNESTGNNYATEFREVFTNYQHNIYKSRKDVVKALKDRMDDTYETQAQRQGANGNRRAQLGGKTLMPTGTVIVGAAVRLSKRINLALENRHTFIKDDLLDGQMWQEWAYGDAVHTRDFDSYNFFSLGLNFNLGANSVEPLYWLNPLDYVYNELNNPRHMKIPQPEFMDSDGDGVVDQLDKEPNTPAGCPVDTHGVSLDTDGDGVPDCLDKQKITPTECQPVDADGVGKCPCCGEGDSTKACPTDYPSITFRATNLDNNARTMLQSVANRLKDNPNCTVTITGYPDASKASQALCNRRVEQIKNYLVETLGITADRISTQCIIGGGDKNTYDIKSN